MGESQWYYSTDGEKEGPVDTEALRRLAAQGVLQPTDYVWRSGMADWAEAGQVKGLFAAAPPPPPASGGVTVEYVQASGSPVAYAGFWLRFVAALLDGLILLVPGFILGAIVGVVMVTQGGGPAEAEAVGNVVGIVLGWLYFALMESSKQQGTVGKMALGLKVTDANGNPISFGRATGRHFGKIISALTLLIGYIMAGFTERKQALHDLMADCLVVKKGG